MRWVSAPSHTARQFLTIFRGGYLLEGAYSLRDKLQTIFEGLRLEANGEALTPPSPHIMGAPVATY